MGHSADMPGAYRLLAQALRNGELTPEEREFLAQRLDAMADAVPDGGIGDNPAAKTAVCHALLLARGRAGKTSAYESETLSFQRAFAMKGLIDRGIEPRDAANQLAPDVKEGFDPRAFLEAWNKWAPGFDCDAQGVDLGPDPRT